MLADFDAQFGDESGVLEFTRLFSSDRVMWRRLAMSCASVKSSEALVCLRENYRTNAPRFHWGALAI